MRRRIVVTGGNGFVGREVVRRLYHEHEVLVLDTLRTGRSRFGPDETGRYRLERCDVTDAAAVGAALREFVPDVIVHLAAVHYIPECEQQPALAVRTNVDGTVNLLAHAPPGSRFVYASSGAVYTPADRPHREADSALVPTDVYGFTKLHGEQYVGHLAAQRGLAAVVVRLFNVVGPGETNPHLLPEVFAQLRAGRRTIELGNLTSRRDYIHVYDAARGFVAAALDGTVEPGRTVTVNLGTSVAYSVAEVMAKVAAVVPVEFQWRQRAERQRASDRPYLAADIHEIARRFGWTPRATLDDALADLWRDPDLAETLAGRYT